jgi:predicted CopG family antitoxin
MPEEMAQRVNKLIVISEDNYNALRQLGHTGDSFNDVITGILKKRREDKGS